MSQTYVLIADKILFFAILSYMLSLSARNFMSHKHNAVVNRHRHKALKTFKALADAASNDGNDCRPNSDTKRAAGHMDSFRGSSL